MGALPQVPSDTQTDDPRTTVKWQPQTAKSYLISRIIYKKPSDEYAIQTTPL